MTRVSPLFTVSLCKILLLILVLTLSTTQVKSVKRPNILVVLTDDQDYELNSLTMMTNVKELIGKQGVTFENMFVTTPVCCPSRSSILSGRYVHNHRAIHNSYSGGCDGAYWKTNIEPVTFATYLKKAGYTTFYAGKYLNRYGFEPTWSAKVPPGWDSWNGLIATDGQYFYNYNMSRNGTKELHGSKPQDYLTNLIRSRAQDFLKWSDSHQPFFMMLAPTAPHIPATPIPPHMHNFSSWKAPRNPNYGFYSADKHWILRQVQHPLKDDVVQKIDALFRDRWRSLQSVDELVHTMIQRLDQKNLLDNTYVIYTSDNGYHLGQFCLPWGKVFPYEFDVRVPLLIRGPKVAKGVHTREAVLNIDLAPTILSLAGVKPPSFMDGRSIKSLLRANASRTQYWRKSFLLEYYGSDDTEVQKYLLDDQRSHTKTREGLEACSDYSRSSRHANVDFAIRLNGM